MGERPKKRSKKHEKPLALRLGELPLTPPLHGIPQDDLEALDHFCNSFELTEVSFETWEACLDALEVRVPVWIDPAKLSQGTEIQVSYSRRVQQTSESATLRETVEILLPVPAGTREGTEILWPGYGDHIVTKQGDLIVTIHVCRTRRT